MHGHPELNRLSSGAVTTTPTDPAAIGAGLGYVREDITALRAQVTSDLTAIRTDVGALANEVRTFIRDHSAIGAVLTHRVDEAVKDIERLAATVDTTTDELTARIDAERIAREATTADTRRSRVSLLGAAAVAVLAAVLSWIPDLIP